jgi:hypothetical protein
MRIDRLRSRAMADELPATVRVKQELTRLTKRGGPIVAGPFLSEVGFEVLYWIPMLAWAAERHGIDPARLTVVSRGGPEPWYADLAGSYVDAFDHLDEQELKAANDERVRRFRTQKQLEPLHAEVTLATRAATAAGVPDATLLHPSLMYELFMPFWRGRDGISLVEKRTRFRPLPDVTAPSVEAMLGDLPERFVAVKFYSTPLFPFDEERRAFVRTVMARLTAQTDVVVLAAPVDLDDHEDFSPGSAAADRVHHLPAAMTARDNLAVQTVVLRRASALVATFGGFTHLAPFLGTRTLAFTAAPRCLPHVDVMSRAVRELRRQGLDTGFSLLSTEDLGLLGLIGDPAVDTAPF